MGGSRGGDFGSKRQGTPAIPGSEARKWGRRATGQSAETGAADGPAPCRPTPPRTRLPTGGLTRGIETFAQASLPAGKPGRPAAGG